MKHLLFNSRRTKKLKVFLINENPDGNFPGHGPNPWADNATDQLKKEVLRQKADLGIIFDADADRVFFADNRGCLLDPDEAAYMLIWHLKPKRAVADIRTGWLISKLAISDFPLSISKSKAGHYFIKKIMRQKDADLGVEKSGHYYFRIPNLRGGTLYYDDGILAALEMINAVSRLPYSLADFSDLLPKYYRSGEINIRIQNSKFKSQNHNSKSKILKKVEDRYKNTAAKISHLDGLSMEFESNLYGQGLGSAGGNSWWFNLRFSNTEPFVRLNMEAENDETLEKEKKKLLLLMK